MCVLVLEMLWFNYESGVNIPSYGSCGKILVGSKGVTLLLYFRHASFFIGEWIVFASVVKSGWICEQHIQHAK